jgi:hypothetical protein
MAPNCQKRYGGRLPIARSDRACLYFNCRSPTLLNRSRKRGGRWGSEMGRPVLKMFATQDRSSPMTSEAMSPLRRRMIEDLTVRKFVEKTQKDNIRYED